ncbi:MAG: hypothetical protein R3C28_28250 [Pirellulaceae bacterium]
MVVRNMMSNVLRRFLSASPSLLLRDRIRRQHQQPQRTRPAARRFGSLELEPLEGRQMLSASPASANSPDVAFAFPAEVAKPAAFVPGGAFDQSGSLDKSVKLLTPGINPKDVILKLRQSLGIRRTNDQTWENIRMPQTLTVARTGSLTSLQELINDVTVARQTLRHRASKAMPLRSIAAQAQLRDLAIAEAAFKGTWKDGKELKDGRGKTGSARVTVLAFDADSQAADTVQGKVWLQRLGQGDSQPVSVPLFNDLPIEVGDVSRAEFGGVKTEITFTVQTSTSEFANPNEVESFTSDDALQTLILKNGDRLSDIVIGKGGSAELAENSSLRTMLGRYVNRQGVITLPNDTLLIAFETDSDNPADAEFDFADLLLHVDTHAPVIEDRIETLVNRIDPMGNEGSSNSDGSLSVAMWDSGDWRRPGTAVYSVPQSGTLEQLRIVVKGERVTDGLEVELEEFAGNSYFLEVYKGDILSRSNTFFDNSVNYPTNGNFAPEPVPDLSYQPIAAPISVEEWGRAGGINPFKNFLLTFDLSDLNIQIDAGEQYVFVLYHGGDVMRLRVSHSRIEVPIGTYDVVQAYLTPPSFYDIFSNDVMASHYSVRRPG